MGQPATMNIKEKTTMTTNLKSFHYLEDGEVTSSILFTEKVTTRLDSGFYDICCEVDQYGSPVLKVRIDRNTESVNTHNFPDKNRIDSILQAFFNPQVKKTIKDLGYYHKLGMILAGNEGTGKSSIVRRYAMEILQKHEALVFYINDSFGIKLIWQFIRNIRTIQDNPIVIIFEEFDGILDRYETLLKTILDGNLAIDNCIFFATTNYLEKIPAAIKNRPSRFKYVFTIEGVGDEQEVANIIQKMLENVATTKEILEYSQKMVGNSLDQIKQFCIDKIMNIENYTTTKKTIGFSNH